MDIVRISIEWGLRYEQFFFFMKIQSNVHFVLTKYQQMERRIVIFYFYFFKYIAMQLSNKMNVDVLNDAASKSYVYYLILCIVIFFLYLSSGVACDILAKRQYRYESCPCKCQSGHRREGRI